MQNTKPKSTKPFVLIVDDSADDGNATRGALGGSVRTLVRTPNEVIGSDLNKASLVLVDFKLESWPQRDQQPTSLRPQDGIALAAILRSNLPGARPASPTAFALRSGKLHELSDNSDIQSREHVIARSLEFEWVFSKNASAAVFAIQVNSLARAVSKFPKRWPALRNSRKKLFELLAADGASGWLRNARDEIERASPPEDVLAVATNGMAVLRWLLHEVLPYPTFLIDERYLAARLHMEPSSLRAALARPSGKKAFQVLRQFEYRGVLQEFLGRRWWRSGIEHWLWAKTRGHPQDAKKLQDVARNILPSASPSPLRNPVVSVDDLFRPTDMLLELSDAVQVSSDDWPTHADSAWIALDTARADSILGSQVVLQDRARL